MNEAINELMAASDEPGFDVHCAVERISAKHGVNADDLLAAYDTETDRRWNLGVMAKAVYDHALANYESDGWDYVVECWSIGEIADRLEEEGATSNADAIAVIGEIVALQDEIRQSVRSEMF